MCGIVGRVAFQHQRNFSLSAAIAALAHRGPDAQASVDLGWAVLGHTRLAILDLDPRSDQPYSSPDGRWVLVYNGEVYNYLELRDELERSGAWRFTTTSDTEVVLASLVTWGPDAVKRFNGMWALCLVDTITKTALLSRDRFGVKPLFHQVQPDGSIVFASRVNALLAASDAPARPSLEHLRGFLTLGVTDWGTGTFYDGVSELAPGTNMTVDSAGNCAITRYYRIPDPDPGQAVSTEEIESLLTDSVRLRLRSDVPVAITLSGGLDSSLIAALVARERGDALTVTASIRGNKDDESEVASRLAAALGLEWLDVEIDVDRLDLDQLAIVVAAHDGPSQSPAAIALDSIMRRIRERGYLVALEGQGADEVFGGYGTMLTPYVIGDHLRRFDLVGAASTAHLFASSFGTTTAVRSTIRSLTPGLHSLYLRQIGVVKAFGPKLTEASSPATGAERRPRMSGNEALLQQRDVVLRSLLTYGDRMSMAHAVEARQPFLDYRLVDLISRLSAAEMVKGGQGKAQLRQVAERLLPIRDPIDGPKRGFVMPVRAWMQQPEAQSELLEGYATSQGIYSRAGVQSLLARNAARDSPLIALALFRLLMGEYWLRSAAS